ncbi:hypothetical protein JGS22_007470 [Streptomyces sp. P38-E01]|uniref:Uncharacterized protein n=1 Tax=Streptomyces tardus TaxID=2780544 RepID=A0A949N809_9ACTN|nr:DUF6274 family protein [Streptomyces tardus]MBU7597468.1 hypothetical protein [Streptomyces tardus]
MATARGPRQHRRHSTKALLRAHLSAAARLGPHSTPRCAVCHRLRRLAAEHPVEPFGSAVPFVPATPPAPSARLDAPGRGPEPAPRQPEPPALPGDFEPREPGADGQRVGGSAPREPGAGGSEPRETGRREPRAAGPVGTAQPVLPAGQSEPTGPRGPAQPPAVTRGPTTLGEESGTRDRHSGSLVDAVRFTAPHPADTAPLAEIPAVHPLRPSAPALTSPRGADDSTTAEAATAAVRATQEPYGSRGA